MVTPLKDDPMLSFNDPNRDHVDSVLRYKKTHLEQNQYKQDLDRISAEQAFKKLEERQHLREFEPKTPVSGRF